MLDLDAVEARTFDFALGGKTYTVPTIDCMDAELALDVTESGEGIGRADMVELFRKVMAKHAPGALGKMNAAQLNKLIDAWKGTGDAGESSASSD